jgi:hypothetical protein
MLCIVTILSDFRQGKPLEEASLYGPISLLPIMSKVSEKAMLKTLHPIKKTNSVTLVRKRTIPTERPPLVGEDAQYYKKTESTDRATAACRRRRPIL